MVSASIAGLARRIFLSRGAGRDVHVCEVSKWRNTRVVGARRLGKVHVESTARTIAHGEEEQGRHTRLPLTAVLKGDCHSLLAGRI